jgi:hypothetical protein
MIPDKTQFIKRKLIVSLMTAGVKPISKQLNKKANID